MSVAATAPSRYERLVGRYTNLTTWPTSWKVALLAGIVAATHVPLQVLAWAMWTDRSDLVDVDLLLRWTGAGFGATALVCAVSLGAARSNREARWTLKILIVGFGAVMVSYFYLFGTLTTPMLTLFIVAIYVVVLFFDVRAGVSAFAYASLLMLILAGLESSGVLPHAPVLVERSLDAYVDLAWSLVMFVLVAGILAPGLLLLQFSASARQAQEVRLAAAHEALLRKDEMLERGNRLIRRYVPAQLASKILEGSYDASRRPERRKLTLFFSDVAGFTAAADEMEPEDLAQLLNEYLAEMAVLADRFGATVNQFVGDGIMAFFGAPDATNDRDHALRCVRMALAMQARMRELRERWFEAGVAHPFRIRIGINTGVASVGDFGSEGRTTYSAIGNQTNLTARVQAACEPGRVLITHTSWALVKDTISCTQKGELTVKGLHYPVRVYEVAAAEDTP